MADLQKTIEVIFKGVDNTSGALSSIGSNLSAFSSSVGSVTGPIAGFTTSLLKIEGAIVAVGAAAIGYAVGESIKFENAFLDFRKVAEGVSDKDLPDITKRVEELGARYGLTGAEVLASATDFVTAGKSVADSFELAEVAALAAGVSELSTAQATDVLTRSLAGFVAPASDGARILDILNKVADNSATSFPELASGFADLAPIAKTMNLSFEETAAFLVPIIERFGSGSEAANALKTAFVRLIDPTKETRGALDEVGIAQRKSNGDFLTGRPLLEAVQKQFGSLTHEQKLYVASQLVGINQAARFVPLLDDQTSFTKALTAATEATGSAFKEFQIRAQSAEFQIQVMQASFKNAAKSVGDEFRPSIAGSAGALSELFNAINKAVSGGQLDELFKSVLPFIDGFNEGIKTIAKNLPEALKGIDFKPIHDALDDLSKAFGDVFEGLDLSTPEGLRRAIQQIVDVGALMIRFTSDLVEGFTPFIRSLADGAKGATTMGREVVDSLGKIAGAATAINAVLPFIAAIGAAFSAMGAGIGILSALNFAKTIADLDSMGSAAKTLSSALGQAGLLTAVAGAGYEAGKFFRQTDVGKATVGLFTDAIMSLTGESSKYNDAAAKMLAPTVAVGKAMGEAAKSTSDLSESTKVGGETAEEYGERMAQNIKTFLAAGEVYDGLTGETRKQSEVLKEAAESTRQAEAATKGFTKTIVDGVVTYEAFGGSATKAMTGVSDSTKKAKEETEKIKEKMLELASDERIKKMEFSVKLNIANIEADTARIKASFESVNNTIDSTGQVIASAFGALKDIDGFLGLEKLELIEKQLEKENEHRKNSLELQKDLVKAQIREIDARADALSKNQPMIQIDGKGLEPEIEAFMFKILKKIQVRANSEQASFLLGI